MNDNPAHGRFTVRPWATADDPALRTLMAAHMRIDPDWPPDYAKSQDLAQWLGAIATLGRWVAEDQHGALVGHAGLGRVRAGPPRDFLCAALSCGPDDLAEICRLVVDPEVRGLGLSGVLTRAALRAAIERGWIPVSCVSTGRGSWLKMMLDTGWRDVGRSPSQVSRHEVVALVPPQRFIDAAAGR